MKENKILYIHNADFSKNSANSIQVRNQCSSLNNEFEVFLVGFSSKKKISFNFENKMLKSNQNYYFRSFKLVLYSLLNLNLYQNIYTRDLFVSFFFSFFGKKVIYELHELPKNLIWKFLFRISFSRLFKLVVISNGLKNDLISLGFCSDNIVVLPDGVDINKFNLKITKAQAKKEVNFNTHKKYVLYIGSFKTWKGYETLINSFKYLKKDLVKIVLIGGRKDQINILAKKYPEIKFKEFVPLDKVPLYLKAADILVLPNSGKERISSHHTSPLKLFEYMIAKRPIISSNLPSIKEIVSSKEVLFFKPDDEKDLANKINKFISEPNLSKIMVTNSFNKVMDCTWDNRSKSIWRLYDDKN